MDPYRTLAVDDVPEAPRDPGIVGDVIRQFADPKAFFRELVQNAIDAGSPSVEVRIEHDPSAQKLRVAVDRGEGMSRDTLENQLLVLFRSTKETDPTKIGKFGIGFASVLAPEPKVVIADSSNRMIAGEPTAFLPVSHWPRLCHAFRHDPRFVANRPRS